MSNFVSKDWFNYDFGISDTVTNTSQDGAFTIWVDEAGSFTVDPYSDGTKLLRDYAMRSNEYIEKKEVSQRGWKSRYDLRNV